MTTYPLATSSNSVLQSAPAFVRRLLTPTIVCSLALLLLVVILWIPFGLNVGFTTDDWHFFGEVDQGGYISMPLRPFTSVPWRIAGAISPESFVGANLLLLGMLYLKALLVFLIICAINIPMRLAFAVSALMAVYPADTGVFWISTLNLNFAIVNLLIAVWALLRFWHYRKLTSLIIMWMAIALALGTYEPTFLFAAVAPALLLLRNKRITKDFIRITGLWYAIPLIFGARYIYIVVTQPAAAGYQQRLFDPIAPLNEYLASAGIILRRHFLDGWLSPDSPIHANHLALAIMSACIVLLSFWFLSRYAGEAQIQTPRQTYRLLFGLGVAVMILGLLPYVVTSMRAGTLRTYYYSSAGAAMIVASLTGWLFLEKLNRALLFAGAIAALTVAGTYSLLQQHAEWAEWSLRQQNASAMLVRVLGTIEPETVVIVVDESPDKTFQSTLDGSWFLSNILNILYRDYSLRGVFCEPDTEEAWGSMVETCQFDETGLIFKLRDIPMYVAPYDDFVLVRHLEDNVFTIEQNLGRLGLDDLRYDPFSRVNPSGPLPERLETLFGVQE